MLFLEKVQGFTNNVRKSKAGIWLADTGLITPINNNILFVIENKEGKFLHAAHNIVTNTGDIYYAEKADVSPSPTNDFTELSVSTNAWSIGPSKTSDSDDLTVAVAAGTANKAKTAGYQKVNDGDADNTGAGTDIVSWLFNYAKTDFNDPSVVAGAVHVTGATFGAATADPLLTAFAITSFAKTADDTLKIFVNHEFLGV